MKPKNPFDTKLDNLNGRIPQDIHDEAVYIVDTLDICWAAAQSVFEKHATPEDAFEIFDILSARLSNKKKKQVR